MKKVLMIAAIAMTAMAVQAQTSEVSSEGACGAPSKYSVETNSFWSNWFISAGATYNIFYTDQEKGLSDKPGMFDGARSTMGASLALGKWITPGFGLRTKLTGIWGRYVTPDATGSLKNTSHNSYKYFTLQEQMLFNVHNLLLGYNEQRLWNFIPYVGFGMTRNWSNNDNSHGWSAGLLNTFRISQRLLVNFELGLNLSDDRIFNASKTSHQDYGTAFDEFDRNFSVELGLTYNIGRTGWTKTPDVEAIKALSQQEIAALNDRLNAAENSKNQMIADKNAKIADLEQALAASKAAAQAPVAADKPAVPMAAVSATADKDAAVLLPVILFRKGVSTVDMSEYPAIDKIIKYMRKHPDVKIHIMGYASIEGDAERNQELSTARAEAVRNTLVKRYRIAADRLTAEGLGATDSLFEEQEYNRIVVFSVVSK